jgi:hypothetical protein
MTAAQRIAAAQLTDDAPASRATWLWMTALVIAIAAAAIWWFGR